MDFGHLTEETKKYVRAIIECIDDGVWITDGKGYVMETNTQALGCQRREDIIGKNMKELVDQGIYDASVTLEVIREKQKITRIQRDETEVLVTGIPHMENGEIEMVVCCERELKELDIMKEQLRLNKEKMDLYESELEYLRSVLSKEVDLVLESRAMQNVVELAVTAARFGSRVLIEGETGVGKEIVARIIYRNGSRSKGPFIAVNCGAIPENLLESELFGYEKGAFTGASEKGKKGYFELANKGVLFLDEIGDISLNFQAKLLRVLQESEIMRVGGKQAIPVDVQVIAASNRNLRERVAEGDFRDDLFYRLNTFPISVPPLRKRQRDIVPLVYLFAENFNSKYGTKKEFSLSSLNILQKYRWPGNVRELENLIERLILTVREDIITENHVRHMLFGEKENPERKDENKTLKEAIEQTEKELIEKYMEQYDNPSDMEKALGISRATLNRKIMKYGLR